MTQLDIFAAPPTHSRDEDCTLDPQTECCTVCGVYHGDPCRDCHARGFHRADCPEMEGAADD